MNKVNQKPLVYRYYDELRKNHFGKDNAISRTELAKKMGVDLRRQKQILREINENPEFHKLVSTSKAIYLCKYKSEVLETLSNTWNTAITLINKAKAMTRKMERQGQYQIKFGNYYKDFVTVFEDKE